MKLIYATSRRFNEYQRVVLKRAMRRITPDPVELIAAKPGQTQGVFGFGVPTEFPSLAPGFISTLPSAELILARDLRRYFGLPPEPRLEPVEGNVLYFDIESHDAELLWDMHPDEFFRLGQYAWGAYGDVVLTTDRSELIEQIRKADLVVGHNIHAFDLTAVFGKDSLEPLEMARDGKVFDTFIYAQLALPAPDWYYNKDGRRVGVSSPGTIAKWLSLDNVAFQLDVEGKIGDLKAMAKKYGGFGKIPIDDPEFEAYAIQDVKALQEITSELLKIKSIEPYDWREQAFAGICAQNSRNGWRVDVPVATARRDFLAARKEDLMNRLVEEYNFPTEGKQPWRSNPGKEAIFKLLSDNGLTEETVHDWKRTDTGNLSLSGEEIIRITKDTELEEFGRSVAELMGQRSLSQLTLDSLKSDGFVHPKIAFLQRSGRLSTTEPGLTVWSSRDPKKAVEKKYYIPDSDDHRLVGFDYSNADARIVAACSGDTKYGARFIPDPVTGKEPDGHEINGRMVFKNYDTNPAKYRDLAKGCSHAWNYGGGAGAIVGASRGQVSMDVARLFVNTMAREFRQLGDWQEDVRAQGESGFITNDWGRRMVVTRGKSFTQSPALIGQSGTREIMVDGLIKLLNADISVIAMLKAQIHDEVLFSIPVKRLDEVTQLVVDSLQVVWEPKNSPGQPIPFNVAHSQPALNWYEAGH